MSDQLDLFDTGESAIPAGKLSSLHLLREVCIAGRWQKLTWLLHHGTRSVELMTTSASGLGHCRVQSDYEVGLR